ncbi:MAG TPA: methyltransferase domain-containing protein [Conexivisphaerales archaeon]|nr:methyltransferase domain-containing protein [Conexivisphaerales archaeon]
MSEHTETEIKLAVKAHYAAASRGSSCCGGVKPAQGDTDLSLGCGSPVRYAGLKPGMTVLDLGSGGGVDVFAASRAMFGQGKVIGVDATPEMIQRSQESAAKLGIRNVEFRLGELEKLPVDDESVDLVLSNCVINLVPDKKKAFGEAFRVMKHGGVLTVSDVVADKPLPQRVREDLDLWSRCEAGCLTREELRRATEEVGFVDFREKEESVWKEEGTEVRLVSMTFSARKP